MATMAAVTEL
jgi:hypothetical protein